MTYIGYGYAAGCTAAMYAGSRHTLLASLPAHAAAKSNETLKLQHGLAGYFFTCTWDYCTTHLHYHSVGALPTYITVPSRGQYCLHHRSVIYIGVVLCAGHCRHS